jgi:cytochrome c-type biogenesis protein CcmE
MRKILVLMLLALLATIGLVKLTAVAQAKEKPAAAAKEARWHGLVVRVNKDVSTIDVKRGNSERRIYFDSSTQWTKGKETIDMSQVKEGSDVICLGKFDEKGEFHATRIDLRH